MSESTVRQMKELVQQSIDHIEATMTGPEGDRRALARVLALLWAAQDELGLAALPPPRHA